MTARSDCLVIGAGLHVTLITDAEELQASKSWPVGAGGIIYDEVDGDLLRADIGAASAHSANLAAVDAVIEHSPRVVRELLIDDLQVAFDRDAGGALKVHP